MKKLNVLLIDDDEITNFLNASLLNSLDFVERVKIVTDGKQGLDFLRGNCGTADNGCPELVIFDHHMPVMDGLEMIRELNSKDFMKRFDTVFLLLGIKTIEKDIEVFTEQGVAEITTKPLSEKTVQDIYNKYWSYSTPGKYN